MQFILVHVLFFFKQNSHSTCILPMSSSTKWTTIKWKQKATTEWSTKIKVDFNKENQANLSIGITTGFKCLCQQFVLIASVNYQHKVKANILSGLVFLLQNQYVRFDHVCVCMGILSRICSHNLQSSIWSKLMKDWKFEFREKNLIWIHLLFYNM